jgi:hypothetical protein
VRRWSSAIVVAALVLALMVIAIAYVLLQRG